MPVDGVIVDGVTGDADVVVRLTTPVRLAMPVPGTGLCSILPIKGRQQHRLGWAHLSPALPDKSELGSRAAMTFHL